MAEFEALSVREATPLEFVSRTQALRSETFVVESEYASMPLASVSVGNTRIEVAQWSLTKM